MPPTGQSGPPKTTLSCGRQRAGPLGGGLALMRTFRQGFPPQWLVGLDRLRCKWFNLSRAATAHLGGSVRTSFWSIHRHWRARQMVSERIGSDPIGVIKEDLLKKLRGVRRQ